VLVERDVASAQLEDEGGMDLQHSMCLVEVAFRRNLWVELFLPFVSGGFCPFRFPLLLQLGSVCLLHRGSVFGE